MAIKNADGKYIKIDQTRLFKCNGLVPILIYASEDIRRANGYGIPSIVNLRIVPNEINVDKTKLNELVTELYIKMKSEKIKTSIVTIVEEEKYKNWSDC